MSGCAENQVSLIGVLAVSSDCLHKAREANITLTLS